MKSDGTLHCSFYGNPRDAIIFTFMQPQDEEWNFEAVVSSNAGRAIKETFIVNYPESLTKKYGILLPHTYLSQFCLILDIISFGEVFILLAISFYLLNPKIHPLKSKKQGLLRRVLSFYFPL